MQHLFGFTCDWLFERSRRCGLGGRFQNFARILRCCCYQTEPGQCNCGIIVCISDDALRPCSALIYAIATPSDSEEVYSISEKMQCFLTSFQTSLGTKGTEITTMPDSGTLMTSVLQFLDYVSTRCSDPAIVPDNHALNEMCSLSIASRRSTNGARTLDNL